MTACGWITALCTLAIAAGGCANHGAAPAMPPGGGNDQPTCGDGKLNPGEACDDGNTVDGDGCEHDCTLGACSPSVATGCTCGQVAAGAGDIPLPGQITRLLADPARCFVYALNADTPSELVVIDTARKVETQRVPLPEPATDLAISPGGNYLVASHNEAITIIDPATWTVGLTLATRQDAYSVKVDDNGIAYYGQFYVNGLRRLDLRTGIDANDVPLISSGDFALTQDGRFLYFGEDNTSGGILYKLDLTGEHPVRIDTSNWANGYGFPWPERHVYVSPGGEHVYYAGYQLDATSLKFVSGRTREPIYAENGRGTFAVGASHVFDAQLVRPIAELPHVAATAVLTPGDRELWYYSADTQRLYHVDPQELIAGAPLGVREVEPRPIASYQFTKLIHDPVRPRLYGLATAQDVVVAIDASTLQPIREIRVGTTPTDLDVDPAGTTLFVGQLDVLGFARIDLASLTFERFVVAPRVTYGLVALDGGRIVTVDYDQWTSATLTDAATGGVLANVGGGYQCALNTTADRTTLFIGESALSGSTLFRFASRDGKFVKVDQTHYDDGYGFPFPPRTTVALPDGSGVYYAGFLIDGHDLSVLRYPIAETVVAVSPDGRRALSASSVFDVATGARLGALPAVASALAISPDSSTAFVAANGAILSVDLGGY